MNDQPTKENPLCIVSDLYTEVLNAQKKLLECGMGEIKLSPQEIEAAAALCREHIPPLEPVPLDPVFELVRLLERELKKSKERNTEPNGEE